MSDSEQDGEDADTAAATDADGDGESATGEQARANDADVASLREELLEDVRESDPGELADELAARQLAIEDLQRQLADLEAAIEEKDEQIEDLTSRLKRKQADFQNYKKRMERKREDEKRRATEDLVERLLDVRDNLERALEQGDPKALREGVESTFRQFEGELDRENVEAIEPEPGDAVDPERHEVLARIDADQPEGVIADVHRPGYEMGEKVLRPAQVAVSDGADEPAEDGSVENLNDTDTAESDGSHSDAAARSTEE